MSCFVARCLSFCPFLVAIVFPVLRGFTDSNYLFGIFKLFLYYSNYMYTYIYVRPILFVFWRHSDNIFILRQVMVVTVWSLVLQLLMQSVPITTNVVSSNPTQAKQHYQVCQ